MERTINLFLTRIPQKETNALTIHVPPFRALLSSLLLTALLLAHFTPAAHADNLTKLFSFSPNYSSGIHPISKLIQAPDGYFYGTTQHGGINGYGTIFRMSTGGTVTTLYSFDGANTGYSTFSGLFRDTDGTFYGATFLGGVNSYGVIYKMTIAIVSGNPVATVTPYYSFKGYNSSTPTLSEPGQPCRELIKGSDGKLYGTTQFGGVNNAGCIYSLTIVNSGTPTLSILHSCTLGTAGGGTYPQAGVTEGNDGKLYGAMYDGGANGYGSVYSVTKDGATYTDIHDFAGGSDGTYSQSQLTKSTSGDLYSITQQGGSYSCGTLYKISSTGVYSQLYTFDGNAGKSPVNQLIIASDGKLYGVTQIGGPNSAGTSGTGTVFQYDLSANTISVFCTFDGINSFYANGINQGTDKNFYGTSVSGGLTSAEAGYVGGNGSAFKVTNKGVISLLYSFYTHTGYIPNGSTIQGPDGQFYGTTVHGGYHDSGTIYKTTANGNVTILHHFNDSRPLYEGSDPGTGLVVAKDGNLYGSTTIGGLYGNGTLYKISTAGVFTLLYSLKGWNGNNTIAPMIQGKDGALYGVCEFGGVNNSGTAFRLSGSTLTILHHFESAKGYAPISAMTQDSVGNLYGTTSSGGAYGHGIIYELNPSGASFNVIYSFTSDPGNAGFDPYASLLYTGGMMYGTAQNGGANGYGTIYKFTPATSSVTLTNVHDFGNAVDGSTPQYGLSLGPDGKFYGATYHGGINNVGTAFSIDTSNNFTTLYSFGSSLTANAFSLQDGVIVGSDNNLYLTTRLTGDFSVGTFDTIDISLHFAVKVSSSVTVMLGTLTLSGGTYNGNLTVKNISTKTILGPVNVVLTGLTGGTTLVNKTSDVPSGYTETGNPYIQANPAGSAHGIFALGAGKSITIPVHFSANTGVSADSQTYLRRF